MIIRYITFVFPSPRYQNFIVDILSIVFPSPRYQNFIVDILSIVFPSPRYQNLIYCNPLLHILKFLVSISNPLYKAIQSYINFLEKSIKTPLIENPCFFK